MITYRKMDGALKPGVESLIAAFLREDEHYLASSAVYGDSGGDGVGRAIDMFLARPELGFVWVGVGDDGPVACCVICFAISTSTGTLVAKLDDVYVAAGFRGQGIGSQMLTTLAQELCTLGVTRIDTAVHFENPEAKRYYERNGFRPLNEERLSRLLKGAQRQ